MASSTLRSTTTPVMVSLKTTSNTNSTAATSGFVSYFKQLADRLGISLSNLALIAAGFVVVLIVFLIIIVYFIRRKGIDDKKKLLWKKDQFKVPEDDFAKYESPYGFVDMNIYYDKKKRTMKVQNMNVNNVASLGQDVPDCYVKVFMLNKDGKRVQNKKTKTIDNNPCPTFPEVFSLSVPELDNCVIYFQVFDENKYGNDTPMGDGRLIIDNLPREDFVGFIYSTYVILDKSSEVIGCGEVCIILNNNPPLVHVNVLEAKDLRFAYETKSSSGSIRYPSVYAVVKFYVNGHKKKVYKTKTVSNTRNPYFCESCGMSINLRDLGLIVVKVELHEFLPGRITKRIGRVCLGNKTFNSLINDLGMQHVDYICNNIKSPRAMWHALITG